MNAIAPASTVTTGHHFSEPLGGRVAEVGADDEHEQQQPDAADVDRPAAANREP